MSAIFHFLAPNRENIWFWNVFLPCHAAVFFVEYISSAGTEVLFDHDESIMAQGVSASNQKLQQLGVCEMAETPLYPDEVVVTVRFRVPLFKPHIVDGSYSGDTA